MQTIKTKGMIIKEYSVGESDKFISIFTKSNGKIMVTAPQAKKYNKGFASGTQLFVYAEFVLQEHRGNYKLMQVDIIETFHSLRENLISLSYSVYLLDLVNTLMELNVSLPEVLRLMIRALQAMCKEKISPKLIRHIFELKLISMCGFMPRLFECSECSMPYDECATLYFDIQEGGIICSSCVKSSSYCYTISQGTLYTMQYIVTKPIDELFGFTVFDQILFEFSKIMSTYIRYYVDKELKTLQFIKEIEKL